MNKKLFLWVSVFLFISIFSSSILSNTCVPDTGDNDADSGFFACFEPLESNCNVEKDYTFEFRSGSTLDELTQEGEVCELGLCEHEAQGDTYCAITSSATCTIFEGEFNDYEGDLSSSDGRFSCDEVSSNLIFDFSGPNKDGVEVQINTLDKTYQGVTDSDGYLSRSFYHTNKSIEATLNLKKDYFEESYYLILNETEWFLYNESNFTVLLDSGSYDVDSISFDINFDELFGDVIGTITLPANVDSTPYVGSKTRSVSANDDLSYSISLSPGFINLYSYLIGFPPLVKTFHLDANEEVIKDFDFVSGGSYRSAKTIEGYVLTNNDSGELEPITEMAYVFLTTGDDSGNNFYEFVRTDDEGRYAIQIFYNSSFSLTADAVSYDGESINSHYDDISGNEEINFTLTPYEQDLSCDSGDNFEGRVVEGGACSDKEEAACYQNFRCNDGTCEYFNEISLSKHPDFCDGGFFCNIDSECVLQNDSCTHTNYNFIENEVYSFMDSNFSQKSNCVLNKKAYCSENGTYLYEGEDLSYDEYCSVCGHDSICTESTCDYSEDRLETYLWDGDEWDFVTLSGDGEYNDVFCSLCVGSSICYDNNDCSSRGYQCCLPDYGVEPELDFECPQGESCFPSCELEECPDERDTLGNSEREQICLGKGGSIRDVSGSSCCSVEIDPVPEDLTCPYDTPLIIDNDEHFLEDNSNTFPNYEEINFCYCGGNSRDVTSTENYCCYGDWQTQECDSGFDLSGSVYYNFSIGEETQVGLWDELDLYLLHEGTLVDQHSGSSNFEFNDLYDGIYTLELFSYFGGRTFTLSKEVNMSQPRNDYDLYFDVNEVNINLFGDLRFDLGGSNYNLNKGRVLHDDTSNLSNQNGEYVINEDIRYSGPISMRVTGPYDGLYFHPNREMIQTSDILNNLGRDSLSIKVDSVLETKNDLDLDFFVYLNENKSNPLNDVNVRVVNYPSEFFNPDKINKVFNNDVFSKLTYETNSSEGGVANFDLKCNNTYEFLFEKDGYERKTVREFINCSKSQKQINVSLNDLSCTFEKGDINLVLKDMSYDDLSVTFDVLDICEPKYYELYAKYSLLDYEIKDQKKLNVDSSLEPSSILLKTFDGDKDSITIDNLTLDLGYQFYVKGVYEEPYYDEVESNVAPSGSDVFKFLSICKLSHKNFNSQEKFCGNIVEEVFKHHFEDSSIIRDNLFECNYSYIEEPEFSREDNEYLSKLGTAFENTHSSDYLCKQTEDDAFLYENIDCSRCGSFLGLFSRSYFDDIEYSGYEDVGLFGDSNNLNSQGCDLSCYIKEDTYSKQVVESCENIDSCYNYSYASIGEEYYDSPCLNYNCDLNRFELSQTSTFDVVRPEYDSFADCSLFNYYFSEGNFEFFSNEYDNSLLKDFCSTFGDCSYHFLRGNNLCINNVYQPTELENSEGEFSPVNSLVYCNDLGETLNYDLGRSNYGYLNQSNLNDFVTIKDSNYNEYICYQDKDEISIKDSSNVISIDSKFSFSYFDELYSSNKDESNFLTLYITLDELGYEFEKDYSFEDVEELHSFNNILYDGILNRSNYARSMIDDDIDFCNDFDELDEVSVYDTQLEVSFLKYNAHEENYVLDNIDI
ncbi:MAG: hypothetical protein ACOCP4_00105, partial [Candidatus Woesearchaeota archaeon]